MTTTFGYDLQGNQTTIVAPLSRNTTNAYDELNRLKQITDPGTRITQFQFTFKGGSCLRRRQVNCTVDFREDSVTFCCVSYVGAAASHSAGRCGFN